MSESFDIIIIGGGVAANSAALTCLNRGKAVGIITNDVQTSSLYKAEQVTNYPGFASIGGAELAQTLRQQLEASGAEIISGRALSVVPMGDAFGVAVENEFYSARAVILAVGITRERLFKGEAEFLGRGVSYCATCDGMLYRGKSVAVIGNNEEAVRDAEFLKEIGCTVHEFKENAKFEITGDEKVQRLIVNGEQYEIDCAFIIKDTVSVSKLVPGLEFKGGAIVTARDMQSNIPGVFAAGDCAGKPYQLAKAAGEGNIAALSACEYIATLNK